MGGDMPSKPARTPSIPLIFRGPVCGTPCEKPEAASMPGGVTDRHAGASP